MKTKSIIGVLAMISLSFAACEKPDLKPDNISTLRPGNDKAVDQLVPKMLPRIIFDSQTQEQSVFAYDDAGRLSKIANGTVTKSFEYDGLSRLVKVVTTNPSTPGLSRIIDYNYGPTKLKLPISLTEKTMDIQDHDILMRTVYFKFNAAGLKISESEIVDPYGAKDRLTLFEYDSKNNCTAILKMTNGKKTSSVRFDEFDAQPNELLSLNILQLLPGETVKKNNAQLIITQNTDGIVSCERHAFEYLPNGWPVKEFLVAGSDRRLLKTISYLIVS